MQSDTDQIINGENRKERCKQGRHRFNTSGAAVLENYSLHGAARPKVNTRSLDGSRKGGGAMPSNSKSGGAKASPAPPSVLPLVKY